MHFNPRSPRGGATIDIVLKLMTIRTFQSTLPTRGSDCFSFRMVITAFLISIHAPHEGERRIEVAAAVGISQISIHAPHEGERPCFLR